MMNRATLSRRAPRRYRKTLAAMAASTVLAVFNPTAAAAGAKPLTPTTELAPAMAFAPTTAFVQAGMAGDTQMLIAGATWEWAWHKDLAVGRLGGYWEASFGRWNSHDAPQDGSAWVTQLGVTPVLRLYPKRWGGRWFVEAGIGANVLLPIYRSKSKRFSTVFNFGDHLAIGKRLGESGRHALALRLQHFSNAGIKKPNPGEDFVQIRYSWYF